MKVRLWLVYKFTKNYCRLRLFLSLFKLKRGILTLLRKRISYFENYLSYQAKIFLVRQTPRELTLFKISQPQSHVTLQSWGHLTNRKSYISIFTKPMESKLRQVVT